MVRTAVSVPRWLIVCVLIGRYISGRPMTGKRVTDSTFFRRGTKQADAMAHPWAWSFWPGWKRAGVRLGVPAGVVILVVAWLLYPRTVESVTTACVLYFLARAGTRVYRALRQYRHRKVYVKPMAAVLGAQLGISPTRSPDEWLSVPVGFADPDYSGDRDNPDDDEGFRAYIPTPRRKRRTVHPDGKPVLNGEIRVMLPPVSPDDPKWQMALHRSVSAKTGIPVADIDASFRLVGAEPYAVFRRAARPPKKVSYSDIEREIMTAPDSAPILGIGARNVKVAIDLDTDAPHVGVSCGSGAGKSVLLRAIIAQFLRTGSHVVILDGKRISQSWCKDLPNVTYCRTGEQFHNALLDIQIEVDRRNALIDSVPAEMEDSINVGQRIVIVFEEQNIGMQLLTEHWARVRQPGDPKKSPAVTALDYILCTGRQVRAHVISVAQMFTVQAAGGNPAARENYGIRILARATKNAWQMLAPECGPPFPKISRIRGRMYVVLAGVVTEVQTVFLKVKEARSLATRAVVTPEALSIIRHNNCDETMIVTDDSRYTLAEAARQEWCSVSYETLRQRKSRAREQFPTGKLIGKTRKWTREELAAYTGNPPPVDGVASDDNSGVPVDAVSSPSD